MTAFLIVRVTSKAATKDNVPSRSHLLATYRVEADDASTQRTLAQRTVAKRIGLDRYALVCA